MTTTAPVLAAAANAPKALWYLTRGSGTVALVLLTASVVAGILTTVRWSSPRWPRLAVEWLHRNVALLAVTFLAIHIITAVADSFAPIGWIDTVVPFRSPYRPLWLGLGAVALDLLLAVALSSLVRRHLSYRVWKAVHWTAYGCWPVAVLHGLGTGSDAREQWMLVLDAVLVAAVVGSVWWRLRVAPPQHAGARALAWMTSALAPLVAAFWVVSGPLQPGWARAAGTPAALLHQANASQSSASSGTAAAALPAAVNPFSAPLTGTLQESTQGSGAVTVDLQARLSTAQPLHLDVTMHGAPAASGGIIIQDGKIQLGPINRPDDYSGEVDDLKGDTISGRVRDGAGRALDVVVNLSAGRRSTAVTGDVTASAVGGEDR